MAQRGFSAIVPVLVRERPGLGHFEYARIALDRGLCRSDSEDPIFSLGTTLAKAVREHRMPEVKRIKVAGEFRYYPSDHKLESSGRLDSGLRLNVTLSGNVAEDVRLLVGVKGNLTPDEALIWLANEGSKARRRDLDNLRDVWAEIEQLKKRAEEVI